jgi:hypothetical protein
VSTPAALVVKPPEARSTVPAVFMLIVSVPRKLLVTVKDGPEKTSVPLIVVFGIASDTAFALEVPKDAVVSNNPAVASETLLPTFRYAERWFLKIVEMENIENPLKAINTDCTISVSNKYVLLLRFDENQQNV